ncbi:hypothetical protein CAEBREN_11041 [Caenorhabditis brenneri]|uniref:DUF7154 domain-containing protein n=1 Tax=Caenorhabditis brenneri TaxID=135651 RepID=G0PB13_CAEBE|nr:hypothetical protein CAEBREN_11041 [Caenorhabditis brenneri]
MLYFTNFQKLWQTYANIRFDTRNEEQIAYHYDFPPSPYATQQLTMVITFVEHPRDGSVKSLNYALTDPNGEVNTSGVTQSGETFCYDYPVVNNTIEYTLTVNYEYEKDREGYLEMRFYSGDYKIGYWLPFDN